MPKIEKIVILGNTQHSHMLREMVEGEDAAEIVAYTIDSKFINEYKIIHKDKEYPVVPFEKLEEVYPPSEYKVFNTVGYSKMNDIRSKKSAECLAKGYEMFTFVSKKAIVLSNVSGGVGNVIMPGSYVGTNVKIGNNNVIYSGSILTHDITIKDNSFVGAGCTIGGNVVVGNNCFLGLNSTVKNGIKLADYSLIGAAAYVNKDTEEDGVYAPARTSKLERKSFNIL